MAGSAMRPRFDSGSERFLEALRVAATLHAGKARKKTDMPDVGHLLGTCSIAMEFGANEDQAIAALLHDTIEDVEPVETARPPSTRSARRCSGSSRRCTDADTDPKPPWRERKEAYLAHLPEADAAILLVSASDKLHNARAIVTDLHRGGAEVWNRFSAPREDTLWYYRSLVGLPGEPREPSDLVDELDRTVTEMEHIARDEDGPRELPFAAVGQSGIGDVAQRVDEILAEE